MTVIQAYRKAFARRGFIVPILLGVRLLSVAVIAPIIGLIAQLVIWISGQGALTDQDIAYFILSPLGFPLFLLVAALILIGTVIGFAAITITQITSDQSSLREIPYALGLIGRRLPRLLQYAVLLVLRVSVIVAPFATLGMYAAHRLLGAFDINYYLTERPPEFIAAVAIGGVLGLVAGGLLISRLLAWALSLHYVLFDQATPRQSFAVSGAAMEGEKLSLLKDLGLWFAIRAVMLASVGVLFIGLLDVLHSHLGGSFRFRLGAALLVTSLWVVAGFVVAALSIGALARIVGQRYQGPITAPQPSSQDLPGLTSPLLFGTGVIAVLGIGFVVAGELLSSVQSDQSVLVIAHRGAAGTHPENTLPSLQAAVEDGADWVELDVQETADGEVVVIHDSDLMKQAQVDLKIWNATMADLADIDIGSWFDPSFSDARVPTLAQALEVTRDQATLLIELKYYGHDEALEQRVIDIVERAGMADQVAVMSLKYPAVQKMMALEPTWPAGVLAATAVGDLTRLDGAFIAVNSAMVTPRLLRQAQEQGKQVFAWTVNDPLEMMALISLGIDGLITDEPKLARDTIAQRAALSTHERLFLVFLERFGLLDRVAEQSP